MALSVQAEPESSSQSSPFLEGLKIKGKYFLIYEGGRVDNEDFSHFFINRAYLTVRKQILPYLDSRLTLDTNQDGEGDGAGDMEVRLKYAYARFHLNDFALLTSPSLEFGIVHIPWLDYEEHINLYRMRGQMFVERWGLFNSADFGVTFNSLLGGELNEKQKRAVHGAYPGRYGSVSFGIYNGGGYHAPELNENKAFEGRLSLRPLSEPLPGLQLSYGIIAGEGNVAGEGEQVPDFRCHIAMLSFSEHFMTLTAQAIMGEGNQAGTRVVPSDSTEARPFAGYSVFAELHLSNHWRIVGDWDNIDLDTDNTGHAYTRYGTGIGYDFGKRNILMADFDTTTSLDNPDVQNYSYRLVMQIKF
jgi:hypothetical protein